MKDTHQPATTKIYTHHTAGRSENISNVRLEKKCSRYKAASRHIV